MSVQRINWVSEIQSDAGRRFALVASFPFMLAFNCAFALWAFVLYAVRETLELALGLVIGIPVLFWKNNHELFRSIRLRWNTPKERT